MKPKTARRFLIRNAWKKAMMGDGYGCSFRRRWSECLEVVGLTPKKQKQIAPDMTIEEMAAVMGIRLI